MLVGAGCSKAPATTDTTTPSAANTATTSGTVTSAQFVGTWKSIEGGGFDELTLNTDGTFVAVYEGKPWDDGTWKLENNTFELSSSYHIVEGVYKEFTIKDGKFIGKEDKAYGVIVIQEEWEKIK